MSTGQTILTLGSIVLLTILVVNVLKTSLANEDTYTADRLSLEAIALATSINEEASQLPFDEVCWDSTNLTKNVSDFTLPGNLGPEAGEVNFSTFDDFDDFNGYAIAETTLQCIYNISCQVCYVAENTPNVISSSRTYYKRLTIITTNQVNSDTLRLFYVHGYWYFN
jgi:hypothetical protein